MVKVWEYDLTIDGWLLSVITPFQTVSNINPWGPQDDELAAYFAISSGLIVGSAMTFGYNKSRLAYYMGMIATSSNAALAMGGLGILAILGSQAQFKSMTVDKAGVRGTGSFGVAPSLHLEGGKPWWM